MTPGPWRARVGLASLGLLVALPLGALSAGPGFAATPTNGSRTGTTLTLTAADTGRTVVLRRGESLRVVLSANAGTGYSWDPERIVGNLIEPLGVEVRQAPAMPRPGGPVAPPVGGPQQITFLFRAVAVGQGSLSLKFWRPWEGETSIIERFRVPLVVVRP
jgi:predicted secreted protein